MNVQAPPVYTGTVAMTRRVFPVTAIRDGEVTSVTSVQVNTHFSSTANNTLIKDIQSIVVTTNLKSDHVTKCANLIG